MPKVCRRGHDKSETNTYASGPYRRCKICHNEKTKEYRIRNTSKLVAQHRKYTYGLDREEALELFESSDGLCALCYEAPATHIDHDHVTGKVRGALCHGCNIGLGHIERMGATSDSIVEYMTTEWKS